MIITTFFRFFWFAIGACLHVFVFSFDFVHWKVVVTGLFYSPPHSQQTNLFDSRECVAVENEISTGARLTPAGNNFSCNYVFSCNVFVRYVPVHTFIVGVGGDLPPPFCAYYTVYHNTFMTEGLGCIFF